MRVAVANLENFAAAVADLGYRPGSSALVVVSPAFDGWLWSVLSPFMNGATCVTIDAQRGDLARQIVGSGVTNLCMTPTLYASVDELPAVEVAVVAGERSPAHLTARLLAAADRVINVYGPTEATIGTTMADTARGDDPGTVGRPLRGCTVEVVDDRLDAVPPGWEGEILIGGAGVALGYLGADSDGPQPFAERAGARFYRSGDVGVMREDGQLECRRRLDGQVKVGGYRIEYQELESIARQVSGVRDAVAYLRGTPHTVAVAIVADACETEGARLIARLRSTFDRFLPRQLCPTAIHTIDMIPVDATTGKVARRLVEAAASPSPSPSALLSPQGRTSTGVIEAWEAVFCQPVDPDSDFFALGGHSLLAAQLAANLSDRFQLAVSVIDVLSQPSPEKQAAVIHDRRLTWST